MNKAEKDRMYERIIEEFEAEYQETSQRDGIPDSSMARAGFYGACLRIVRDGPRMKSAEVQARLTKYYTDKQREAYQEVVKRLQF